MMIPSDFRGYSSMRPTSEVLKSRRSVLSEQTEQLNNWYEDLQKYEKSLEDIATATLDQSFKEELQHVDQWFCYLSDAERTATIYTLLQHNSPVQTRFFINILQQQKRDSILTLPEQDSSPFYQAEKEVTQRLMNIMPYKTGQPKTLSSTNLTTTATRQPTTFDRHSIAIGETDDYSNNTNNNNRVFPTSPGLYSNPLGSSSQLSIGSTRPNPTNPTTATTTSALPSPLTSTFPKNNNHSRPSSSIDIDHSPDFFSAWRSQQTSSVAANNRHSFIERPKSADLFGEHNSNTITSVPFQPWGISSTLSLSDIANLPHSSSSSSIKSCSTTNHIPFIDKPLPTITTVNEKEEENHHHLHHHHHHHLQQQQQHGLISPYPTNANTSSSSLMNPNDVIYSNNNNNNNNNNNVSNGLTPASAFAQYYSSSRSSSPVPSTSTPTHYTRPTLSPSHSATTITSVSSSSSKQHHKENNNNKSFGAFLDPKDVKYHQSRNQNNNKSKNNNNNNNNNENVVDMELLKDVPSWFRSLRLHKYNPIFESMKWQDIIKLSDDALQAKGVAALGARRKMLKVFETIQQHCKQHNIPY
ncbi:hypothetical protein BJ944DRAFT_206225 [Cunninghamella echinulata]|nr:hypothetical protein BJ944DRAFT_206225 [Cunninghamella echinulata]